MGTKLTCDICRIYPVLDEDNMCGSCRGYISHIHDELKLNIMRWNYNNEIDRNGKTRTITKFAILPISVGGTTIWFEKVSILQIYRSNYASSGWENIRFV